MFHSCGNKVPTKVNFLHFAGGYVTAGFNCINCLGYIVSQKVLQVLPEKTFLLFLFHIFHATVFTPAASSSSVNIPAQRETCNTGVVPMTLLFTSCWVRKQQTHTLHIHCLVNLTIQDTQTHTSSQVTTLIHKAVWLNPWLHSRRRTYGRLYPPTARLRCEK